MNMFFDFRYALRLLLKRPAFTVLTVSVMAVGIGLSVYMFSFINTMAFKPLPFKDGHEILVIDGMLDGRQLDGGSMDPVDLNDVLQEIQGLKESVVISEISVNVSGRDSARRYSATLVESGIFNFTRTEPLLGRGFTPADDRPNAELVAVVSHSMWQSYFGGDPDVIDQTLRMDGHPTRIIGVMPEDYFFPRSSDIWLPIRQNLDGVERGTRGGVSAAVRMQEGVTGEEIDRQAKNIMQRLEIDYPESNSGASAYAKTYAMGTMGDGGMIFIAALYTSGILMLLLAAINVGNLLLSQALERGKETAIRVALGAPRSRLIMQMLWGSVLIVVTGGLIGLLGAGWGLEITERITHTFTDDKPFFWWRFGIDGYTLAVFSIVVVSTIVITGVFPAWRASGGDFNAVLRDGTRGAMGRKEGRLNRALVIAEVFLSVAVLIAAGVMVVSTYQATHADYGVNPENIETARITLPVDTYDSAEKRRQFYQELTRELQGNSGIEGVALMTSLPGTYSWSPTYAIEGEEYVGDRSYPRANNVSVMPGSMATLSMPLIEGRYFDSRDDENSLPVAVVSESIAQRYWPGESALGRRLRLVEGEAETSDGDERWITIVGVVKHAIHGQSFTGVRYQPSLYFPLTQRARTAVYAALKYSTNGQHAGRVLQASINEVDPDVPAYLIKPYEVRIARNSAGIGFASRLFLIFGIVTVLLAASGIYGVMSNTILQRTQEIGVKRALGASDGRITSDFMKASGKQLLIGAIPGILVGGGLGYMLSALIGTGNLTLAIITIGMSLLLAAVVMIATWFPTRRVLLLEPCVALRYE